MKSSIYGSSYPSPLEPTDQAHSPSSNQPLESAPNSSLANRGVMGPSNASPAVELGPDPGSDLPAFHGSTSNIYPMSGPQTSGSLSSALYTDTGDNIKLDVSIADWRDVPLFSLEEDPDAYYDLDTIRHDPTNLERFKEFQNAEPLMVMEVPKPTLKCWDVSLTWMTMLFKADVGYWALCRSGLMFCLWRLLGEEVFNEPPDGVRPGVTISCSDDPAPTYTQMYDNWFHKYFMNKGNKQATWERFFFFRMYGSLDHRGIWKLYPNVQTILEMARYEVDKNNDVKAARKMMEGALSGFRSDPATLMRMPKDPVYEKRSVRRDVCPQAERPPGACVSLKDIEGTGNQQPVWKSVSAVLSTRVNIGPGSSFNERESTSSPPKDPSVSKFSKLDDVFLAPATTVKEFRDAFDL